MGWLFWIWYSIGTILLLTIGVPKVLDFSNGIFLVFYALYALYLIHRADLFKEMSDQSVSGSLKPLWSRLIVSGVIIWLGGMGLEWVGVHSGWPFGEYEYTSVLGALIYGVPWTLGFAWIGVVAGGVLLSSSSHRSSVDRPSTSNQGMYLLIRACKVGIWVIILDLVLDPVAHARGFWHWAETDGFYGVPWSNFVAWFIVGGLLSMVLPRLILTLGILRQATFLYQAMLLFFGLLAWQADIGGSMMVALIGIILAEGNYRYDTRR